MINGLIGGGTASAIPSVRPFDRICVHRRCRHEARRHMNIVGRHILGGRPQGAVLILARCGKVSGHALEARSRAPRLARSCGQIPIKNRVQRGDGGGQLLAHDMRPP